MPCWVERQAAVATASWGLQNRDLGRRATKISRSDGHPSAGKADRPLSWSGPERASSSFRHPRCRWLVSGTQGPAPLLHSYLPLLQSRPPHHKRSGEGGGKVDLKTIRRLRVRWEVKDGCALAAALILILVGWQTRVTVRAAAPRALANFLLPSMDSLLRLCRLS